MSSRDRLLTALAAVSAAGYLVLALAGDLKARPTLFLAAHGVLFVLYIAGVLAVTRGRGDGQAHAAAGLPLVVGAALLFRLLLLPAAPTLSDDIYRYIWEGGVQLHGINPYRYVPSAPELAPYRDRIYEAVTYKDLPAIYPPLTQWAFALGALLSRSTTAMKTIFVAADMALVLLLAGLLRALGMPARRVLVYAWNPLVVVEIAGSGHNDSLAVCLLVASTVGIIRHRRVLSIAALAMSALAKLFPLALLPLFARKVKPLHLALAPCLVVACYLPYHSAGGNLFRSAREYAQRWRANDAVFSVLVAAVDASGVSPAAKRWADAREIDSLYTQPHMIARALAGLIALGGLGILAWRLDRDGPMALPRSIYLFTGLALLLQPAMHPWYLVWVVPWLALFPSPAWLALTGLAPLAYAFGPWVRWVEYPPFFALLALGAWAGRRAGGGAGARSGRVAGSKPEPDSAAPWS